MDLYQAVRRKTFNAQVIVLGYPQLFPASLAEQSCTALSLFAGEQDFLRQETIRLNSVVQQAANDADVTFQDATGTFAGHEVCGSAGAWINGPKLTLKSKRGLLDDQSFHPNLAGQQAYAQLVNAVLSS